MLRICLFVLELDVAQVERPQLAADSVVPRPQVVVVIAVLCHQLGQLRL